MKRDGLLQAGPASDKISNAAMPLANHVTSEKEYYLKIRYN